MSEPLTKEHLDEIALLGAGLRATELKYLSVEDLAVLDLLAHIDALTQPVEDAEAAEFERRFKSAADESVWAHFIEDQALPVIRRLLAERATLLERHKFKENLTASLTAANAEIARLKEALTAISKIQRDKLEWADAAMLYMVLDNKVDIACAALSQAPAVPTADEKKA